MESQKKASKKWREKNKDKILQYKLEFHPKDHDLLERFERVKGKTRNDRLRYLLDLYDEFLTKNYELKQESD